ncbi:MAG: T9SS type A sorting domain-containing protein [bacterium]|nr:T9SS type A sorting domain-containing protein [bacterium]
MRVSLKIFIFTLMFSALLSSSYSVTWKKTYGGIEDDIGNCIQQTQGNGYIIAAETKSYGAGNWDAYIIKIDSLGDTLWTNIFGGSGWDGSRYIEQTTDSGYIVAGYTNSFGAGNYDVWLVKMNSSGDTMWSKTFGDSNADYGECVQQTIDSGYIIVGTTKSCCGAKDNIWLLKTDPSGDTIWTKNYGGTPIDFGYFVQQTKDKGYILTGNASTFGGLLNIWLIKTDSLGDTLWTRVFGGSNWEYGNCVQQTSDSGYIIAGETKSFGAGAGDLWVIKVDKMGDSLWAQLLGGTSEDGAYSVKQTRDGGYIVAGGTKSYGAGNADVWLLKINSLGDTLWTKTFGGTAWESGWSVQQVTDGGYIISGATTSYGAGKEDVWIIKTDSMGTVGIEETNDKCVMLNADLEIIKNNIYLSVPNTINADVKIYDLCGRLKEVVYTGTLSKGSYAFTSDIRNNGIYFVKFEAGNYKETKKLVLIK